jgi:hypothetical protein
MSEKLVVFFESLTPPAKIPLDYFFNKIVAFYECVPHTDLQDAYQYFYDGNITEAIKYLESIGFEDVRILANKPYSIMQGYLTLKREE